MGVDECGVDVVVADGQLPYRRAQLVAVRVGAEDALVVAKTLVDDIPLRHFAFEVVQDVGDVVLHDVESLLACPALVILLAVVAAEPFRGLLVP